MALNDASIKVPVPRELLDRVKEAAFFSGAGSLGEYVRRVLDRELCRHSRMWEGVCGECGFVDPYWSPSDVHGS